MTYLCRSKPNSPPRSVVKQVVLDITGQFIEKDPKDWAAIGVASARKMCNLEDYYQPSDPLAPHMS